MKRTFRVYANLPAQRITPTLTIQAGNWRSALGVAGREIGKLPECKRRRVKAISVTITELTAAEVQELGNAAQPVQQQLPETATQATVDTTMEQPTAAADAAEGPPQQE